MKKLLAVTFALALLAGCTTPQGASDATSSASPATSLTAQQPETSLSAEPAADETPASDSDYVVTINGSRVAKDYKDRPALVVDLTFTNNSDKARSFMFATRTKAFQDGVELESAMFIGDDVYDAANSMKDIKPGKSIAVQEAYVLDGDADVEIEVTELISFDDALLASATISVK